MGRKVDHLWLERGKTSNLSMPVSTEKKLSGQDSISVVWDCMRHILLRTRPKNRKIGKEYLTPYCNNYDQWIQYQTYDVTEQMKAGGELSVLLGDGWYKGRFGFSQPEKKGFFGDAWKVIAEVHIDYADGSKEVIGTDESWKVTESKISFLTSMMERREMTLCRMFQKQQRFLQWHRRAD